MDSLVHNVQEKLKQHPANEILQRILTRLSGARVLEDAARDALKADVETLRRDGVVDAAEALAFGELLSDLNVSLPQAPTTSQRQDTSHDTVTNTSERDAQRFRYVQANLADTTVPLVSFPTDTPTFLPVELVQLLNQAYFLHVLANEPEKALPPGKSLISVLSRSREAAQGEKSALQERVENIVHAAFWDEAYESLSNPVPSMQLTRLKLLYLDLHTALSPLLPSDSPVLVTLSSHFSPTSYPLHSTIIHLREILRSLRERCAPHRDEAINALIRQLDVTPTTDLAKLVVEEAKAILKLAENMKDDLSQFVLGNMGEQQLYELISVQAAAQERELVMQLWRPPRLQELWKEWLEETEQLPNRENRSIHEVFVYRLGQALGSNEPVHCELPVIQVTRVPSPGSGPSSSPAPPRPLPNNALPPPLFFVRPTLLLLQNYLQALVIAGSLRALVRIPSTSSPSIINGASQAETPERTFMERVWALLKAEIEGETGADSTKLVNLADEVVRVRRMYGNPADADEEAKLRAAVDRTIQVRDPVFQLLQRRLVRAITERLAAKGEAHDRQAAPVRLRTGRAAGRPSRKPLMTLDLGLGDRHGMPITRKDSDSEPPPLIKGFEDPVLVSAIKDIVARLERCVEWTETVWADVFDEAATEPKD